MSDDDDDDEREFDLTPRPYPLILAETPPPDPALLEGGAWDRKEFERQVDSRVRIRTHMLLEEYDIDLSEFELACRLVDDVGLRDRLTKISRRSDLATLRAQVMEIDRQEKAVLQHHDQICEECGGDGAILRPSAVRMCDECMTAFTNRPSTPPANGIRSALGRARRAKLPATLTNEQWQVTVNHFNDRCAFCGGPWCLVEHATSVELGGGTTAANCLPSCTGCNVRKGSRRIEELSGDHATAALAWLRKQGRKHG